MINPTSPSIEQMGDANVRGTWRDSALDQLANRQQGLRIAVIESDVEIVLHRVVDDPRWMLAEQNQVGKAIKKGLNAAVHDLGLVRSSTGRKDTGISVTQKHHTRSGLVEVDSAELRYQAARLLDNHARLANVTDGNEFPTLGRGVLRLSVPLNADLVLVSRYRGWQKTQGQWRKEKVSSSLYTMASLGFRNASPRKEFAELEILLLDGVNGDLLWRGHISGAPNAVIQAIPFAFKGCWQSGC